jgi:hypothetical protein
VAAAAAPAVLEIERGNKGVGFGLDSEAVSSLLRHGSTGEFTSVNFMLRHACSDHDFTVVDFILTEFFKIRNELL